MQMCVEVDIAVLRLVAEVNKQVYQVRNVVYDLGAHVHVVLGHSLWSETSEPGISSAV
jgi:hypothetical protein